LPLGDTPNKNLDPYIEGAIRGRYLERPSCLEEIIR
jgi:hypothetical protein